MQVFVHFSCTYAKKAVLLRKIANDMYIHLDCNNFFVSCELISRPELQGTPVVVANDNGNNGGIILALNREAKAVGENALKPSIFSGLHRHMNVLMSF